MKFPSRINKAFFFIWVFCFCVSALGSPVFRTQKTVRQPDGTSLTVTRVGFNHLLYYVTTDGVPVFPDKSGVFCYAELNADKGVVASSVCAHEPDKRTLAESMYANKVTEDFQTAISMSKLGGREIGSVEVANVKSVGDQRYAVILAEFQDVAFAPENDIKKFDKHLNASNYTEDGAGSARDYFIAQSDSLYRPTFDVVAKVKLSGKRSYYGGNSGGNDMRPRLYISEAVDSAAVNGVDFSPYVNEKGELFVIVIYPGQGEHVSGESEQLWAACYNLINHTVGKYKLTSGLVTCELADYGKGETIDGIGTFCHEFSHAMGLPDFYNTNGLAGIFGMDAWSLMDYGQYNNLGRTPAGYTSYEREFMGWLKIETLQDEKQLVKLAPLHQKGANRAYRIPNKKDASGNEYYLIENRRHSTWYRRLYGEGMLVIHVDYNESAWYGNRVNNDRNHPRMTIIPADDVLTPYSANSNTYKGDPFPGLTGATELSDSSTPKAVAYIGGTMGIKLTSIHETADTVVFCYQSDGILEKPQNLTAEEITSNGCKLSFDKVANAETYIVEVYHDKQLVSTKTVAGNLVDIQGLNQEEPYIIKVKAIAADYIDSEYASIVVVPTDCVKEDVDRSHSVNSADAVLIYNYMADDKNVSVIKEILDINSDGEVNSADIVIIMNYISGSLTR